jgi:hypothetical protein
MNPALGRLFPYYHHPCEITYIDHPGDCGLSDENLLSVAGLTLTLGSDIIGLPEIALRNPTASTSWTMAAWCSRARPPP